MSDGDLTATMLVELPDTTYNTPAGDSTYPSPEEQSGGSNGSSYESES